jgi:hypothetical protein
VTYSTSWHAGEQPAGVTDDDVPAHRVDGRVGEGGHQAPQRPSRLHHGVAVQRDDDLGRRAGEPQVQGRCLAPVPLAHQLHAVVRPGDGPDDIGGVVGAAVVDDDDDEVVVRAGQQRRERPADHLGLVVRRDEHAHRQRDPPGRQERGGGERDGQQRPAGAAHPDEHAAGADDRPLDRRRRGHEGGGRHAHQVGRRHEPVALSPQQGDQAVDGGDGLAAVAAGVVEHDDVAVRGGQAAGDVADDGVDAGPVVVVAVDVTADGHVSHAGGGQQRPQLVG